MALGKVLFTSPSHEYPMEEPSVIWMEQICGCSSIEYELLSTDDFFKEVKLPIHPILIMTLVAGIEFTPGSYNSRMPYEVAMSPYLLTDPYGKNFVFWFRHNGKGLHGEFRDLSEGDFLPRCMHIWGYGKKANYKKITHAFQKDEDGAYGDFQTPL